MRLAPDEGSRRGSARTGRDEDRLRTPDQLTLRRLKKQKLSLKDQIVRIEDQLIPDIIA